MPYRCRLVLEKTAQFVAKNGAIFEKKILANEEGNNKFQVCDWALGGRVSSLHAPSRWICPNARPCVPQFLISSNPYHAYYQKKVEEFKSGEAEAKESAAEPKKEEPPPEAVTVIRYQKSGIIRHFYYTSFSISLSSLRDSHHAWMVHQPSPERLRVTVAC